MLRRVLRWWRLHHRPPKPFPCDFCGERVEVYRRVIPYDGVIDYWTCPFCGAGGWGSKGIWYG